MSAEPHIRVHPAIENIDAAAWDALANPDPATLNPFTTHAFLLALERSGTVGRHTGWSPCHLALEQDGAVRLALDLAPRLQRPDLRGQRIGESNIGCEDADDRQLPGRAGAAAGEFRDLHGIEFVPFVPLVFLMFLLGVAPQVLIRFINPLVTAWAGHLTLP